MTLVTSETTFEQLTHLGDKKGGVQAALEFVKDAWVGKIEDQAKKLNIGVTEVSITERGQLEIKFTSHGKMNGAVQKAFIDHLRAYLEKEMNGRPDSNEKE